MFPRLRVALDWLFDRINMDPMIQIKYTDTRNQLADMLINHGKFHTWRLESSFVFVYHEPFQFCRVFWSDVEKNTKRIRWRKSRSEVKTHDEFDCAKQRKGSTSALSFSSSGGLGKTRQESQSPLSAKAEMYDRTEKHVVCRDISHAQGARKTSRSQEIETRSLMKKLWIMIERWHPLSAVTQVTSQEPPKHVPLMKAQPSTSETKQIMIERNNPLSAVTQVTSQVASNQCWTTWTWTSEYLDCHILLWNKLITIVFVSS